MARAYEEAESPAEDYERACLDYEACASLCTQHFAGVTEADSVFREQQGTLYGLLVDADTIWEQLATARDGGGTQRKLAASMQSKIDAMKENLSSQDSSLSIVENELESLGRATTKYQQSIADSRSEHGRVKSAIDARTKSMRKILKSIEAAASEKKARARSSERKDGERKSPPKVWSRKPTKSSFAPEGSQEQEQIVEGNHDRVFRCHHVVPCSLWRADQR